MSYPKNVESVTPRNFLYLLQYCGASANGVRRDWFYHVWEMREEEGSLGESTRTKAHKATSEKTGRVPALEEGVLVAG